MRKAWFLLIHCVLGFFLSGCSHKIPSVSIDDIQLQVDQVVIESLSGVFEIDPQTQNIGGEVKDLITVNVSGTGTVVVESDLEKISKWQVRLFDDTDQEYKLNDLNLSYTATADSDNGQIQFELVWKFIGYIKGNVYSLHLPENNILEIKP